MSVTPTAIQNPTSAEAEVLQSANAGYVIPSQLAKLGMRPEAFFFHSFETPARLDILDVVVFRTAAGRRYEIGARSALLRSDAPGVMQNRQGTY